MKKIEEIKEAIITEKDGVLNVCFGANLNKENENYHDKVSINIENGGYEILIKGRKIKSIEIDGEIFEDNKNFNFYCNSLKDFKEQIEITETKKFSWRTFKREVVKSVKSVWCYGRRFIYKENHWKEREYKANNWVFTEFK
jgi:hypothetical protein